MVAMTIPLTLVQRKTLQTQVEKALWAQPVTDLHTHVYAPAFGACPNAQGTSGGLLLWGIDELVTYHYLVAEVYRVISTEELPYEKFWQLTKAQQADLIWEKLFVERTPVSEACRGVITTLDRLGLSPREKALAKYRKWFAKQEPSKFIDQVMQIANVDQITMTNEVFSDHEHGLWDKDAAALGRDARFRAVLRVDMLVCNWPAAAQKLSAWGYAVRGDFGGDSAGEVRRFLGDWLDKMRAVYLATSLPPEWRYPAGEGAIPDRIIRECLMPVLAERKLPWAMMIGSRRAVNPALKDAGDMGGVADVSSVARLCRDFPRNKFMVTMLARENQHELYVAARKFGNLLPFGCWWFLNNPALIEEMTRMRMELLGTSFVPQHSDARILDQLIYKWEHSRRIIARVLTDKYADLAASGYRVTAAQIKQDAALLLRDNYRNFLKR